MSSPNLKDLVEAVNETSQTARNVINAMLVVTVTLGAIIISTTDEGILRQTSEVIPTIGVRIPLVAVYSIAPIIFLFLHANALLQLSVLVQRLTAFEEGLNFFIRDDYEKNRWRRLLHGFVFTQLFGNVSPGSTSRVVWRGRDWLQRLLLWVSTILVPIVLLGATQVTFIKYQNNVITILHASLLTIDLALIGWFYTYLGQQFKFRKPFLQGSRNISQLVLAAIVLWLSWVEGRPPDPNIDEFYHVRWTPDTAESASDYEVLKANLFDWTCGRWNYGCRYLRLNNRVIVNTQARPAILDSIDASEDDLAISKTKMLALTIRNRNLVFADFSESRLYSIDLNGSNLTKADFYDARLQNATIENGTLDDANLQLARLQGASLVGSSLRGAELFLAHLEGSFLNVTDLSGASLSGAYLMGADLYGADLTASQIGGARFHNASLVNADLTAVSGTGANFRGADLRGANFALAILNGVNFESSTGKLFSCKNAAIVGVVEGDWANRAAALDMIRDFAFEHGASKSVANRIVAENSERVQTTLTKCENGTPFSEAPLPDPKIFAEYASTIACADPHLASSLLDGIGELRHSFGSIGLPLALATLKEIKVRKDNCTGLSEWTKNEWLNIDDDIEILQNQDSTLTP